METLEMVVVLYRHGARFPTGPMPGDYSWPTNAQFWKDYKAHLTPTGALQHIELGKLLGVRYGALFKDVAKHDVDNAVLVQCSNTQRTLNSAWSLNSGMFPDVPRYYSYYSDRMDVNREDAEKANEKSGGGGLGIAINIEAQPETDALFHSFENAGVAAEKFKKSEALKSKELQALAAEQKYQDLADKLYRITEIKKLAPQEKLLKRLQKFTSVFTQMAIAKAHGLPILPNKKGETLTEEELDMIGKVRAICFNHKFRPVHSNKVEDGMGAPAAGFMGHEIGRQISEKMTGKAPALRMVQYSAHDGNVLALAALLGVDVDAPEFTGHWIFELHRPAPSPSSTSSEDDWKVSVLYHPFPTRMTADNFSATQPRQLPLDGVFATYNALPVGQISAKALVDYLSLSGLRASNEALAATSSHLARVLEGGDLQAKVDKGRKALTEVQTKELQLAFTFYDGNGDGAVDAMELQTVFRRLGKEVSLEDVNRLIAALDGIHGSTHSDDADPSITFEEFLCMVGLLRLAAATDKDNDNDDGDEDDDDDF